MVLVVDGIQSRYRHYQYYKSNGKIKQRDKRNYTSHSRQSKTIHIDESILSRIIISEFNKTLFTKEVNQENKEGYFLVYQRIIYRIIEMIEAVIPDYLYAKTLASLIIDGNLHQNYLKVHFKTTTNLSQVKSITDFYTDIIKKMLL